MEAPYDAAVAADVFAEAKNTFNCLIGQLTAPAAGTLTHDQQEETIVERGRVLQRWLLQAHLDLRALRERQHVHSARRGEAALGVAGTDGVVRWWVRWGITACWPRWSGQ
nr:hypothetical protein [Sphaerisporangium perillae]